MTEPVGTDRATVSVVSLREVAMLPKLLEQDRKRAGWSVGRAAWELGVSIREYRELEAGTRSLNGET